jgi:hypothetical protein
VTPHEAKRATQLIDEVLAYFGNGETWLQRIPTDLKGNYCVTSALGVFAHTKEDHDRERLLLDEALPVASTIESYNDHAESFEDIKSLLLAARALATRGAKRRLSRAA